uniref:Secreted protein n=1 Tax=Oryza punctata TaxID=4537 RepID=A0A0E0L8K8_ORYPU
MVSSLLVAFLLLSSYVIVSARSSRPIADGVEMIWSTAGATAATEADGGRSHHRRGGGADGVMVRYLVVEKLIGGVVPSREPATMVRRSPRTPPSPMGHVPVAWEKGIPPCLGIGCSQIPG